MAPHCSPLAWKIPWMEEPGRLQSMGLLRVRHDRANSLSLFTFMHWRRKWQPTPVFLLGESQGRQSLVDCHLWDRTESDTTEATQQQQQHEGRALGCVVIYKGLAFNFSTPKRLKFRLHSIFGIQLFLAVSGDFVPRQGAISNLALVCACLVAQSCPTL